MRNISEKYFKFGPVVKEKTSFKRYFLSRALAALLFAEQNHLCNFGTGHHEE